MQGAASTSARQRRRSGSGTGWFGAASRGLAPYHVGNRVLVEDIDEGTERIVEHTVHAVPAVARRGHAILLDGHMRDLGGAHHIADPDLLCRTRQPDPAVAAAHGLDQPGPGEEIDDLEDVLLGD